MTIDKEKCLDCGACITACSLGLFYRTEDQTVAVKEKPCMECYHCAAACPAQAVGTTELTPAQLYPAPPEDPLLRAVQTRRSIRHFRPECPDRAVIQEALDLSLYAPSGKNEHANRWTVVLGRRRTDTLFQMTLDWAKDVPHYRHLLKLAQRGNNPVTCGAPCLIVGWNRLDALNPQTDTVIAMTLAEQRLVARGLGTCWGGYLRAAALASPAIQAYLGIPEGCRVYEILLVGYPEGERYPNIPYRPAAEIRWLE